MIKLTDLIKEEDDIQSKLQAARAAADASGKGSLLSFSDQELKQGFKKDDQGNIIYVPKIANIRKELVKYKKELRPFKYDDDPNIVNISEALQKILGRADKLLSMLSDNVKLKGYKM
jgi:hypothetical protein